MRKSGPTLLIALMCCVVGCQGASPELDAERERWLESRRYVMESPREVVGKLEWVNSANPYADARRAIRVGDHRFFAVDGHSMILPGVAEPQCVSLQQRKLIPGSVHAREGYEHQKLSAIARVYANAYNFFLWEYLNEFGDFKCDAQKPST